MNVLIVIHFLRILYPGSSIQYAHNNEDQSEKFGNIGPEL
jgi:hypothetical protein